MDPKIIRDKFIKFFTDRGHKEIAPAKLVPENDPTTLFTSSGMQPLVPYLLGQEHPEGKRLVNSQPSFRAEDIEEVGDNRHTTFFEMLGNWSLGDYFKKEQLEWFYQFLTEELKLDPARLHATYFEGNDSIPKDEETFNIWKDLGIPEERIYPYGIDKNWWSRSGEPEKMPVGEIGGTDSEVFYEFPQMEHNKKFGEKCHPHCGCGHFLEIGDSVFIEYKKREKGFEKLPNKNVDFGGGLERLTAATLDTPDVFKTDLYLPIIDAIERVTGKSYEDSQNQEKIRIIADHLKAATFLAAEGVEPSNKLQGYILRRLIRRAVVKMRELEGSITEQNIEAVCDKVISIYNGIYLDEEKHKKLVDSIVGSEAFHFTKVLARGIKEVERVKEKFNPNYPFEAKSLIQHNVGSYIDFNEFISKFPSYNSLASIAVGTVAFNAQASYGVPTDIFEDWVKGTNWVKGFNQQEFQKSEEMSFDLHRESSRTQSAGMFKGGLADHSEIVTKYHTATHLLHQALRDVLGPQVFQKGSNITSERLRFDFSYDKKMTDEEIKKTEDIINKRISSDLKVDHMIVSLDEAKKMHAIGLFNEKYADKVSLYGIGPDKGGYYSLEFCGGPHVEHTGVIGKIKIVKEEAISAGIRRIRAQIV